MIDVVSQDQLAAISLLASVVHPATYLAGGVAVALRLGHRRSRDLDLFVADADPVTLTSRMELRGARILSRAAGTLYLEVGGVPTSILRYPYPLVAPVEHLPGVPIPVASPDDLECMKLSAIAARGAARDFWDLHASLTSRGRSVAEALSAYQRKYVAEDVGHVIRSLVYFDDAEAQPMPAGLTPARWRALKSDVRTWVRDLG